MWGRRLALSGEQQVHVLLRLLQAAFAFLPANPSVTVRVDAVDELLRE